MKDLKERIIGITVIGVCSLISLGIVQGSEIIPPVPVSEQSLRVEKFTEKKKGKWDKCYFFCLQAQFANGEVHTTSGIFNVEKNVSPDVAIEAVRGCGAKRYRVDIEGVVVTAFNRIE